MKRTLDDLRGALHEEADAAAYPDVEALVSGARRRVAATRRRRVAVLGAVTAAVLVVGAMAGTRLTNQALPQPAESPTAGLGPFTVSAGGSGFPEYTGGMKRLTMLDAPMLEKLKGSISVPTTAGQRLFEAMTCTPVDDTGAKTNEWITRMKASFTLAGSKPGFSEPSNCLGVEVPMGIATSAKTTVLADVTVNHKPLPVPRPGVEKSVAPELLFKDAKIHVAIYGSFSWQDFTFPPRPSDLATNPAYAWGSGLDTVKVVGPTTTKEANEPLTFTRPFDPKFSVHLEVRGPGRMRVLINGKDISDPMNGQQTPDGLSTFWGYGSFGIRGLQPDPAPSPGTPVTVTIEPRDFQGPDWRIAVQPVVPGG